MVEPLVAGIQTSNFVMLVKKPDLVETCHNMPAKWTIE
jgi:hypothetical protein